MTRSPLARPARAASIFSPLFGVILAFSLAATPAQAGTLQLRDNASLFSAEDQGHLKNDTAPLPFDVRVLTTTDYADQAALNRHVSSLVSEGNMVVISLDPTHRRTSVHFGKGTRIAASEFTAIEQAGNGAFRQGNWRGGVDAILKQAESAVGTGSARGEHAPVGATDRSESTPAAGFPFGGLLLLGALLLGGIGLVMWLKRRRPPTAPLMGNGPQGYPPGSPGYGGPGYPGGGGGGMGPVGGGLIGAGLGGLAGYELGRAMERNDEAHHPHEGYAPVEHDNSPSQGDNGSWDAGGGSSDWDGGGGGGDFGGGDAGGGGGGGDW